MKKTLSVILALVMALSCFALTAAAADDGLRIFVASDVHVSDRTGAGSKGNMFEYSGAVLDSFLASAASADCVLLTGDITETPGASSAEIAAKLAAFEDSTGKSVFVIDGNHDVTASFSAEQFKSVYARFGYDEAVAVDSGSCSYAADLGDDVRLIAIDSVVPGQSRGRVSDSALAFVREQYAAAVADGMTVLFIMHHPLTEHFPGMNLLFDSFVLENAADVAAALAAVSQSFVFTGHDHITDAASVTASENTVYDLGTGSLSTYPCPYRTVSVTSGTISLGVRNVTEVAGFDGDFAAYAKSFFKENAQGLFTRYLDADVLSSKLGLETGGAAYTLIGKLTSYINEFGAYPMGQLRQIASYIDVAVPANDYASYFDAIMELVAAVTAGGENVNSSTALYKVLYQSTLAILSYAFEDMDAETVSAAVNELASALTQKLNVELPGDLISGLLDSVASGSKDRMATALTDLAFIAIVSDFGVDDKPSDLSYSFINPFKHAEKAKTQSLIDKILAYIHKILDFIIGLFRGV